MISKKNDEKTDTQAVLVRMPVKMIERIDALRRAEDDLPTRPEMIRRLVEQRMDEKGG
ncbi:ribbon-helix-helix protein, CopG family [Roseovarius sp. S1116L3]|uniref:Ribbon-helix-helix protein, copG family n=1 Tax=Roseovarius nanhaiticus TaxID=573024 RepID=A0A1N7EUW3_9RHOB|nr:ribbon-helix-helix protein, CopG family [Roseovarius nanhaiticus]SEK66331.1 Ribbon-helix-helix protein, copG family [Roseovarius nanhaiticus]SIR91837.1 Ribbon-helix-helix protein, copG family [Roseovarius nanhaiticus]